MKQKKWINEKVIFFCIGLVVFSVLSVNFLFGVNKDRNFICPDCKTKSLVILKSIELGTDSRSDEYSLQAIKCKNCGMVGVAIYEESDRGAEETWDHAGYRMEKVDFKVFLKQLSQCNTPTNIKCTCPGHTHFRYKTKYGTLYPLHKIKHDRIRFPMKRVKELE